MVPSECGLPVGGGPLLAACSLVFFVFALLLRLCCVLLLYFLCFVSGRGAGSARRGIRRAFVLCCLGYFSVYKLAAFSVGPLASGLCALGSWLLLARSGLWGCLKQPNGRT